MTALTVEQWLIIAGALLVVSVLASKLGARLGVPALLLFLGIGMLTGSEGIGGVEFDDPWLAQFLAVVAFAFILYSGGLDTDISEIRPIITPGLVLATLGDLMTALVVGTAATYLLDFTFLEGLLLGAIVSSTDAAAVFAVLRGKNVRLKGDLKPALEFESGSNDPMAIFLTIGLIELIQEPDATVIGLIPMFIQQMAIGAIVGYLVGRGMVAFINRLNLDYDGLYSVITISTVMLTYGLTTVLGGNGFLAVYLAGLVSGNLAFIHRHSLKSFHDGIAWLMQIIMFMTLGLLVFPSQVIEVAPEGLLLSALLILLARPIMVFITLSWTKFNLREKVLIAWVGLRGAAPVVLATFPLLAGLENANTIFNIVFFIVLTSVLVQGTTIVPIARWLGVEDTSPVRPAYPFEYIPSDDSPSDLVELTVSPGSPVANKRIVEANLPEASLMVLVSRDEQFIIPNGATMLRPGDNVLVLADKADLATLRAAFEPQPL
ncbi:MAG: potassium/proton antiporter [Chloroflexi bacterium]|nr:potassium/proton antiporter [Chloroflexota bacterium]